MAMQQQKHQQQHQHLPTTPPPTSLPPAQMNAFQRPERLERLTPMKACPLGGARYAGAAQASSESPASEVPSDPLCWDPPAPPGGPGPTPRADCSSTHWGGHDADEVRSRGRGDTISAAGRLVAEAAGTKQQCRETGQGCIATCNEYKHTILQPGGSKHTRPETQQHTLQHLVVNLSAYIADAIPYILHMWLQQNDPQPSSAPHPPGGCDASHRDLAVVPNSAQAVLLTQHIASTFTHPARLHMRPHSFAR